MRPPVAHDHHLPTPSIDVNGSAAATLHGTCGSTSGLGIPSTSDHHVLSGVDEHKPPKLSSYVVDPTAAYESKSNWGSNSYASAGVVINVLKRSSGACTPLKSVAGGLSTVLTYYDVRRIYFLKTITSLTLELANGGEPRINRIINTPN